MDNPQTTVLLLLAILVLVWLRTGKLARLFTVAFGA